MSKKYILLSLEDEGIKSISEILGNKTANKIINFLSEKEEASEKDLADGLNIPLNTVEYNIKKMVQAGIVEPSKKFFWSSKGKKIKMYKFSNKSIVISPKRARLSSEINKILPVAIVSGLAGIAIKFYYSSQQTIQDSSQDAFFATESIMKATETVNIINTGDYWLWFIIGAAFAIAIFLLKIVAYEKSWIGSKGGKKNETQ